MTETSACAQVAVEAAQRQAEQNQEMSHLNREVAAGTKRLVEGQADADQHWQTTEQKIHDQQNQLEAERRQQADARQRDSLLAPVLLTLGVLLVCSLPLLGVLAAADRAGKETEEAAITQLLIDEIGLAQAVTPLLPLHPCWRIATHSAGTDSSEPARLSGHSD